MRANKIQIAEAVFKVFEVDVLDVRTMVMPAKRGQRGRKVYTRRSAWKKQWYTTGWTIAAFTVVGSRGCSDIHLTEMTPPRLWD
jgi:hypothetical protein